MSEKKQSTIICAELPEGLKCAGYQCSDCVFYNFNDTDRDGWGKCTQRGKYYPPDDPAKYCEFFHARR